MGRKKLPPDQLFMGFAVKKGLNHIQVSYDEESYKNIIKTAVSLNLKPQDYVKLVARPCQSCGSENIFIKKIDSNINALTKKLTQIHIFVFENTPVPLGMIEVQLTLDYIARAILSLGESVKVYNSKRQHKYNNKDCEATLILYKNDEVKTTLSVLIKNNKIYIKE